MKMRNGCVLAMAMNIDSIGVLNCGCGRWQGDGFWGKSNATPKT